MLLLRQGRDLVGQQEPHTEEALGELCELTFGGLAGGPSNASPQFSQDLERLVGLVDGRAVPQGHGPLLSFQRMGFRDSLLHPRSSEGERVLGLPFPKVWLSHLQKYLLLAQSDPSFGMEPEMRPGLGPEPSSSFCPHWLGTPELRDPPARPGRAPAPSAVGPRPRGPQGHG